MDHCIDVILTGRSFISIVNLLNNYIVNIESASGEEKAAPYRAIMDQMQSDAKPLLNACNTNKSEIIEVTFTNCSRSSSDFGKKLRERWMLIRLNLMRPNLLATLCAQLESIVGSTKNQDQAIMKTRENNAKT